MSFQKGLAVYAGASLAALSLSTFWTVHAAPRYNAVQRSPFFAGEIPNRVFFRGVVTNANGTPAGGAAVHLLLPGRDTLTTTDAAGSFSFQTAELQRFERRTVVFRAEKGKLRATAFVTPEQRTGVITLRLQTARKITVTGQVTNADGTPLSGVPVQYLGIFPDTPAGSSVHSENGGVTDAAGKFALTDLSDEANYQLSFGGYSQFGYGTTWGKSVYPDIAYTNGWMRLKNGETRNIGRMVVFPADAVVAGRIINPNNRPNPYVVVRGKHCDVSATPNADGTFRLKNIVREPLTFSVYQSNDSHGWSTSPGYPDEVYSGPVRPGDTNAQIVLR